MPTGGGTHPMALNMQMLWMLMQLCIKFITPYTWDWCSSVKVSDSLIKKEKDKVLKGQKRRGNADERLT